MRINKSKAIDLASYESQEIVDRAAKMFFERLEEKLRGRQEKLPQWLQWAVPVPQQHRLRARAQKEFWAFSGPGRRIQKEADTIKKLQERLKNGIEASTESGGVEFNEADYQMLEAGFAAAGGKYTKN